MWKLYEVHGFTYRGPTFEENIDKVLALMIQHRNKDAG